MDDNLARALFALYLEGKRLVLWRSETYAQAQAAFRSAVTFIETRDYLQGQVKRIRRANGEQGIELTSGARLLFRAGNLARGYSADHVING